MYNRNLGYTKCNSYELDSFYDSINGNIKLILEYINQDSINNILNIGCGKGIETKLIYKILNKNIVGIDLQADVYSLEENENITLISDDFCYYRFHDKKFDLIYCYHMLEHVEDPKLVLRKIKQNLSNSGIVFIGFPNKKRLISYLNPSEKISIIKKIQWNIRDLYFRAKSKFENRYGAHAGFTNIEFNKMASNYFNIIDITEEYYDKKYQKNLIYNVMKKIGIIQYLYPCLYYILR